MSCATMDDERLFGASTFVQYYQVEAEHCVTVRTLTDDWPTKTQLTCHWRILLFHLRAFATRISLSFVECVLFVTKHQQLQRFESVRPILLMLYQA